MPLLATRQFSRSAQTHPAFAVQHRSRIDYTTWYIQGKVEYLAGKYTFSPEDGEDIFQELSLYLIRQWRWYEESKSKPSTFIQNIINQRVCEMLRNDQRLRRDDSEDIPLCWAAEYGQLDGVRGQPAVSDHKVIEMRVDCKAIL